MAISSTNKLQIPPQITTVFFLSGVAALIYQTVWIRQASLLMGGSVYSMSVVVSTFMAGLAVGSALFGRIADKIARPLRLYALLEFAVAISAVLLSLTHAAREKFVIALIDSPEIEGTLGLRALATALMLGAPCIIIGGTLPVMVRYVVKKLPTLGSRLGILYSINTFGAAVGALATGFFLIEVFGLFGGTIIAVTLNILSGALALHFDTKTSPQEAGSKQARPPHAPLAPDPTNIVFAAAAFFFSGFTALVLEMAWTRLLVGFLNNGPMVISINLTIILWGFAIGGVIGGSFADRIKAPSMIAGVIFVLIGFLTLTSLGITNWLVILQMPQYGLKVSQLAAIALLILPASVAMGALFPVLIRILVTDENRIGTQLGYFYALNTAGTVIGAIAGPFILITSIGTSKTLVFASVLQIITGLLLSGFAYYRGVRGRAPIAVLVLAIAAFLLIPSRLDIYHQAIRSSAALHMPNWNTERAFIEGPDSTVVLYEMDPDESLSTWAPNRFRIQVDFSMMVAYGTFQTKLMALLPLLAVPDPKDALVICFGMGNTFRSALSHGINVDVVDINAAIPKLALIHQKDPQATYNDPLGRIYINDGRNFLLLSKKRYDMITVDPAPPIWGLGMGNIHTREFFQLINDHLTDQGVAEMWMLSGDSGDFLAILAAFRSVFPNLAVFHPGNLGSFHVLGSRSPIRFDRNRLDNILNNPRISADLSDIGGSLMSADLISSLYITDTAGVDEVIRGVDPLVDDRPNLEYRTLRGFDMQPFEFPKSTTKKLNIN